VKPLRLAAEYWAGLDCWVIVNNAATPCDEDDLFYRLYAHGFVSEDEARRWIAIFELARLSGVEMKGQDFSPGRGKWRKGQLWNRNAWDG
jgi:hypothetical protein